MKHKQNGKNARKITLQKIIRGNVTGQMRRNIIEHLWRNYSTSTAHVKKIEAKLTIKNISLPQLDHLAIIDLPGPHTGIPQLRNLFDAIGYVFQGADYLPDKQNDFTWMAAPESHGTPANQALPQVVIADFRLDELPSTVSDIVLKYSKQASALPIEKIKELAASTDPEAATALLHLVTTYLSGRDWPLPTVKEFQIVRAHNELLAWVLIFGRRPNHFSYAIHLMPDFASLTDFHRFIETEVNLPLNQDGGAIKGSQATGIEQGSTAGTPENISLADGSIELPTGFIEFVWRYTDKKQPVLWNDYYTGFIASHANRVIQSLYVHD